jgi:hypothetical protein
MSIPSKITSDFYTQSIEMFCQPLAERAQIADKPCAWIKDLEKEHADISIQMKNGMEAANTMGNNLLKKLQPRMACIAAIGLGVGLGGFCAVVAGGGVLSIALGIIGALAGILAGVFIGLWAAKSESKRKMMAEYQTVFKLEADWIQGKMEKLNQQIALDGPDKEQLTSLKTHFEKVSQQEADLIASQKKNFFHQLNESLAPNSGSSEAALLKTWNERNDPKPTPTTDPKGSGS